MGSAVWEAINTSRSAGLSSSSRHASRAYVGSREMDTAGVTRAVLVPPSFEGDRNDLVIDAATEHADRFTAMARLDPAAPGAKLLLKQLLTTPAVRGFRTFLARADAVILTVPHTPQTENLIDDRRLGLMKPGAVLVNIGRGPVVDIDAVTRALAANRIRGAAFDVYPREPLRADHPLWDQRGAILTPHVAAVGPYTDDRRFGIFLENARRFLTGEPLVNVVDKVAWF